MSEIERYRDCGGDGTILKIVMMVIQHCEFTKTTELYIAKLKIFMLYEF